ncbi:MAG TPA: hypothetical protein VH350_13920 [Candidatus Sulfotelmatobacter sp.]|nr:hypothetical protein [Candidatus Sulfotelmatobacter sp.]
MRRDTNRGRKMSVFFCVNGSPGLSVGEKSATRVLKIHTTPFFMSPIFVRAGPRPTQNHNAARALNDQSKKPRRQPVVSGEGQQIPFIAWLFFCKQQHLTFEIGHH